MNISDILVRICVGAAGATLLAASIAAFVAFAKDKDRGDLKAGFCLLVVGFVTFARAFGVL